MLLLALTGGIGSGKSTVAEMLRRRGAVILDADAIVHELQEPGTPVFDAMVDLLGSEVVAADGRFDRQAIADRVFGDAELLAKLGEIVHPAVREEMATRVIELAGTDHIVIMDVPLLTESGMQGMAGAIVVDVDVELAVRRLVEFRGLEEADARARVARQASREERLKLADQVIDNSGDLAALEAQVDAVWRWAEGLRPSSSGVTPTISFGAAPDR